MSSKPIKTDKYPAGLYIYLFGLLTACPFGKAMDDCPLEPERKRLKPENYIDHINQLNPERIKEIICHHKNCLNQRESKATDFPEKPLF